MSWNPALGRVAGGTDAALQGALTFGLGAPETAGGVATAPIPPEDTAPPEPAGPEWVTVEVQKGDTLGKILPEMGMPTRAVRQAALEHHDLAKLRAGAKLEFLMPAGEEQAVALRAQLSADRTLLVEQQRTVDEATGEEQVLWDARVDEIIYERRTGVREFVVQTTLWGAAIGAGLQPADIVGLADVYRFDLDFNTEVRAGARARMVVEELWLGGEFVRLGAPLAVRFENKGEEYVAIRYEDGDRDAAYYDDEGQARKKPFLRSPLRFSRVTSGFSRNRYHPVLKKRRPHLGVDFGAPTGTPVYAVGSGKVTRAKVNGGHGRFVKIDHEGPYQSSYSHLSRIAVRAGQTVKQGQVIGYVGSTGLATGPHLHYQFWKDGKIVNPLTVKLPNDGASNVKDMKGFRAWREGLLATLDADAPVTDSAEAVAVAE